MDVRRRQRQRAAQRRAPPFRPGSDLYLFYAHNFQEPLLDADPRARFDTL